MTPYKFEDTTIHTDMVKYLNSCPFEQVKDLLPLINGEATQEYNQDDIIKVLTYLVKRPYAEVFKFVNKLVVPVDVPAPQAEEPAPEAAPIVTEEPKA